MGGRQEESLLRSVTERRKSCVHQELERLRDRKWLRRVSRLAGTETPCKLERVERVSVGDLVEAPKRRPPE